MMRHKINPGQMSFKRWGLISGLVAACLFLGLALAAGEQIPRQVIDSSGGRVSAGNVQLRAAIGQPVAGPVSNGNLALCSGFLCGPTGGASSGSNSVYLPLIIK